MLGLAPVPSLAKGVSQQPLGLFLGFLSVPIGAIADRIQVMHGPKHCLHCFGLAFAPSAPTSWPWFGRMLRVWVASDLEGHSSPRLGPRRLA